MQPNDFEEFFSALSAPRVNAYKSYFGPNLSNQEVFGCYQWNESVSHAFFKLITLIEIVMRNRMHSALSRHYFDFDKEIVSDIRANNWQKSDCPTRGHQNSCNWYNAIVDGEGLLNRKSLNKIHSVTHHSRNGSPLSGRRRPSADDVVSSLTFGFWSSLVDKCPKVDWRIILNEIYPKHRTSNSNQWSSIIERQKLSYRLELTRNFRNRIAHHEPIWKFGDYLSEQPPVTDGQLDLNRPRDILDDETRSPNQSIRRLRSIYSKHTELLRWMSKDIHRDYSKSTLHQQLLWLCSDNGLKSHKERSKSNPESMSRCRFKREISSIIKNKKTAYLIKNGRNLATLQHIS